MAFTLDDDGTISFDMVAKRGTDPVSVTLRLPDLEEVADLWLALDKTSEATKSTARKAATAKEPEPDAAPTASELIQNNALALRTNAVWTRRAVAMLCEMDGLYEPDGKGGFKLVDGDKVGEPAWFGMPQSAGRWLRHWQHVPLDLGDTVQPTTPAALTPVPVQIPAV